MDQATSPLKHRNQETMGLKSVSGRSYAIFPWCNVVHLGYFGGADGEYHRQQGTIFRSSVPGEGRQGGQCHILWRIVHLGCIGGPGRAVMQPALYIALRMPERASVRAVQTQVLLGRVGGEDRCWYELFTHQYW